MTRPDPTGPRTPDDPFDARMRALHADAVGHVGARTRAQLDARRVQARRPQATPRRAAWSFATAAAVAVLALGIGWRTTLVPSGTEAPPATATALPTTPQADTFDDDAYSALSEDPDLFLWLASTDVQPLAME